MLRIANTDFTIVFGEANIYLWIFLSFFPFFSSLDSLDIPTVGWSEVVAGKCTRSKLFEQLNGRSEIEDGYIKLEISLEFREELFFESEEMIYYLLHRFVGKHLDDLLMRIGFLFRKVSIWGKLIE